MLQNFLQHPIVYLYRLKTIKYPSISIAPLNCTVLKAIKKEQTQYFSSVNAFIYLTFRTQIIQ
jgi:hypothetical protein